MDLVLPEFQCPAIFNLVGGTRIFLVRGGPGKRGMVERTTGKCEVSNTSVDVPYKTRVISDRLAVQLETLLTTTNRFDGARIDPVPTVFHDGAPKSIDSFLGFTSTTLMSFRDGMVNAPEQVDATYFWDHPHGRNFTNIDVLKTVVVFCSMETIYRVLLVGKIITPTSRIFCGSGGIVPVMFPIQAPASLAVGMGPFANGALRWGLVTEEEYNGVQQLLHGGGGGGGGVGKKQKI